MIISRKILKIMEGVLLILAFGCNKNERKEIENPCIFSSPRMIFSRDSTKLMINYNNGPLKNMIINTLELMIKERKAEIMEENSKGIKHRKFYFDAERIASKVAWKNYTYDFDRANKKGYLHYPYVFAYRTGDSLAKKIVARDLGEMLQKGNSMCVEKSVFESVVLKEYFKLFGDHAAAEFAVYQENTNKKNHAVARVVRFGIKNDTSIISYGKIWNIKDFLKNGYSYPVRDIKITYEHEN